MIKKDEQMNTSDISFDEMAKLKSDGGDKTDRLILGDGENCIFSSDSNKTGLNNNILVIGTSGCGKTVSIMEPRILETFNRSLIATVTKRRIVKKYSVVMKRRGYKVLDLNFVHPSEGNCGYDPLMHIGSYNDITFLARSIVLANPRRHSQTQIRTGTMVLRHSFRQKSVISCRPRTMPLLRMFWIFITS